MRKKAEEKAYEKAEKEAKEEAVGRGERGKGGCLLRWLDLALNANLMLTNSFWRQTETETEGDTQSALRRKRLAMQGEWGRNIRTVPCLTKPCDVAISQASIGLATVYPLTPPRLPLCNCPLGKW